MIVAIVASDDGDGTKKVGGGGKLAMVVLVRH